MIEQYPHKCLFNLGESEPIWDEENGGWTNGEPGEETELRCRAVPNGSGKQVQNKDGIATEYAFDLAFPHGIPEIPADTIITVIGLNDVILFKGRLIRFQKGQLHSRGWV